MPDKLTPWNSHPSTWKALLPEAKRMRSQPTSAEKVLWERVRARRLAGLRFRRQHVVGPFIVDFICSEQKLVVEVDGPVHNNTQERDALRQEYLEQAGYTVIRFSNGEVENDIDGVLDRIKRTVLGVEDE